MEGSITITNKDGETTTHDLSNKDIKVLMNISVGIEMEYCRRLQGKKCREAQREDKRLKLLYRILP
jgi:hypothetical protein